MEFYDWNESLKEIFSDLDIAKFEICRHYVSNGLYFGNEQFSEYLEGNVEADLKMAFNHLIEDGIFTDSELTKSSAALFESFEKDEEEDVVEFCLSELKELFRENDKEFFVLHYLDDENFFVVKHPEEDDGLWETWVNSYGNAELEYIGPEYSSGNLENMLDSYSLEYMRY